MLRYKKYLVKADDHFEEVNFPRLQDDMDAIKASIAALPEEFTKEIIIAFVRDRSIKDELKEGNPLVAELVNSKSLPLECLEGLFDSSGKNEMFRLELETYIRKKLD